MDIILSLSAWYNFIVDRLAFDAMFIPVSILVVFAFFNCKEYKNKKILNFILTALVITLISRYMCFIHMDMKINTRYLYPAAFLIIILCVPGFSLITRLLKYISQKSSWIKERHLIILLLLLIGIGSIWKALGSPDRKHYIHDAAKIIKTSSPSLLISNLRDSIRVAWHSEAELIPLSSVMNIDNPINFANALKILSSKNKNIFLLIKSKDSEFRKIFSDKKVEFPAKLIFLKEFKARHKRFYSLYKIGQAEKK